MWTLELVHESTQKQALTHQAWVPSSMTRRPCNSRHQHHHVRMCVDVSLVCAGAVLPWGPGMGPCAAAGAPGRPACSSARQEPAATYTLPAGIGGRGGVRPTAIGARCLFVGVMSCSMTDIRRHVVSALSRPVLTVALSTVACCGVHKFPYKLISSPFKCLVPALCGANAWFLCCADRCHGVICWPAACLQAVLQVMLHGGDELERSGASHVLAAFCQDNNLGQMAVLSTVVYAGRQAQAAALGVCGSQWRVVCGWQAARRLQSVQLPAGVPVSE